MKRAIGGALLIVSETPAPDVTLRTGLEAASEKRTFVTVNVCGVVGLLSSSKLTLPRRVLADMVTAGFGEIMVKKTVIPSSEGPTLCVIWEEPKA